MRFFDDVNKLVGIRQNTIYFYAAFKKSAGYFSFGNFRKRADEGKSKKAVLGGDEKVA